MNNKELILLISTIILIIISILIYTNQNIILKDNMQDKLNSSCELNNCELNYDLNNLVEFKFNKSIIYLNCENDKNNVITNCDINNDINDCFREISTIQYLYLQKKNAKINEYDIVKEFIIKSFKNNNENFNLNTLSTEIDKTLNDEKYYFKYADEFNLIRNINETQILNKYKNDLGINSYFENVIIFRDSNNILDCEKILSNIDKNNITNKYNSMLYETCRFYFIENKESYCGYFMKDEITNKRYIKNE